MTCVFSGGIAYEFYDSPDVRSAHWGYGLVREEDAVAGKGLTKLPDFYGLKARLEACEKPVREPAFRTEPELEVKQPVDVGIREIPPLSRHWKAGHMLPYTLADWTGVKKGLDEKAWVEVQVEEVEKLDLTMQQRVISA